MKIGHASIDEKGRIAGGKIGDQTNKEICVRDWYNKPWNVYLECTDQKIADKAAELMEQICNDNNYGYDQNERWTGYHSIIANEKNISGSKGEFDCSSLIISCYILAGLKMTPDGYTGNMKKKLLATGKFKAYTDADHVSSDIHAKRGGIYLKEGKHVVMSLGYPIPSRTIEIGCQGEDVKWVQQKLINDGIKYVIIGGKKKKLMVDGDCGAITDAAIRVFQDKYNLKVDGKAGPITRNKMNK